MQIDVEELAEGGQNHYTHKLPGRMKWPNLVFKRGITDTDPFSSGSRAAPATASPRPATRSSRSTAGMMPCSTRPGKVVRKWCFVDAYPVKWTGPSLAASSRDVAVEELEVCHCGFRASA